MSRRSRLSDSLSGERSEGWKWGCHRLMLLDVSMCLVVWSNDSGININPKILCPEDMFQTDHKVTAPAEDRFLALSARRRRRITVPQLVADHFVASGRRIPATTVRRKLHNAGLYARRPVVCVPLDGQEEGLAYVRQENTFPRPDRNGFLYSSQTSPDSHWRAIQDVC
ncbi:hypothetical protein AVEN_250651-1 [Araneus ventricosus]|uniref:Transposase Tc1-like domain-containing protein n=1 Tax=Araneus ventricosus TaxID=182803 RepID=A0A4Y2VUF6_ARAVE|nr:hypothetical protein AVEN_250651-1 [Araneus ventricosus]